MSSIILAESPSGVPHLVNSSASVVYLPTQPEFYLPDGVSPASVQAAYGWRPYILEALSHTAVVELYTNDYYNIDEQILLTSGQAIYGIGPNSGLRGNFNRALIRGALNAANVRLRNLQLNSGLFPINTAQVYFEASLSVEGPKIDNVHGREWANAATIDAIGCIQVVGLYQRTQVTNCSSANSIAPTVTGTLTGVWVTGYGATDPIVGLVVWNNYINGKNYKQCVLVDGPTIQAARVQMNYVYDSDYTGILFGYSAPNAQFRSIVSHNVAFNCGGAGIYASGNDGVPTPGTFARGLVIDSNNIECCGGAIDGVFANGITLAVASASVGNNKLRNIGYDKTGAARAYASVCIGIGGAGQVAQTFYALAGNEIEGTAIGIVVEQCTNVSITGNSISGGVQGIIASQFLYTQGVISITGNAITVTTNPIIAIGGGPAVFCVFNIVGNDIRATGANSPGIRIQNAWYGHCTNNFIRDCVWAVNTTADMIDALGYSFYVQDNSFSNCDVGVLVNCVAGTRWALVGPNREYLVPLSIQAGGSLGITRPKSCLENGYRRIVVNEANAAPTAGQMPGGDRVQDQVLYLTPSAGVYGQLCTVAGAGGTWKALNYTP